MKKALAAAFILALLFSALAGTLLVNSAKANPVVDTPPPQPTIWVDSPESDKAYASKNVTLVFTVGQPRWGGLIATPTLSIQYYLDGIMLGQFTDYAPNTSSVTLTGLSEGRHYVEVTATAQYYGLPALYVVQGFVETAGSSGKIYFTVDTAPPRVSILSPQNKTYDAADVPFNFTVSKAVSWVGYSLDGKANITITETVAPTTYSIGSVDVARLGGSTVLTGLSAGSHSLTVYAEDEGGHTGESETIHFTIAQEAQPETEVPQEAQPETQQSPSPPFPTLLVATASASAAAVGAGLLLYFRKRNH
jgi:hypothetical protein